MVLPTTSGHTSTSNGILPGASFYEDRTWAKQKPPYDLTLPYRIYRRVHSSVETGGSHPYLEPYGGFLAGGSQGNERTWAFRDTDPIVQDGMLEALNKARERFLSKLGADAGWGENLAEMHQAMGMMSERMFKLGRAWHALKRLDIREFLRCLNLTQLELNRKGLWLRKGESLTARAKAQHVSATWMEFHFGWGPLVDDVLGAAQFLSSQMPTGYAKASKGVRRDFMYLSQGSDEYGSPTFKGDHKCVCFAKVHAGWRIVNPNLFLANRMGLANPFTTAYNLIPLTWLVDWVYDLSSFFNNWSDLFGLELTEPGYSQGFHDVCSSSAVTTYRGNLWNSNTSTTDSLYFQRFCGFPMNVPRVHNPLQRLSAARGATAIAYLIQVGFGKC